jgi:hypothetical protein
MIIRSIEDRMLKARKFFYVTALIPLLIILGFFAWFLTVMFEGESPTILLQPMPEFLSQPQELTLKVGDEKRGLRSIKVSLHQSSRDMTIVQDTFPFQGILNTGGARHYQKKSSSIPWPSSLLKARWSSRCRPGTIREEAEGTGTCRCFITR